MAKKRESSKNKVEIKKSLKDFLADEDGYVSKETVLKIGLGTVAGIGMLGAFSASAGHSSHAHHTNSNSTIGSSTNECPMYTPLHSNSPGHASHSSY